jgi:CPA1 family monovalent cation:H+ antiporter
VPFAAFLTVQQLHASGVLAVVTAGFWLGHHGGDAAFATRLQSRQVWRTADVVLEAFVFAYMGLQVSSFLRDATAQGFPPSQLAAAVVVVLLAVLLIRPLWVFALFGPCSRLRMSWKSNSILSWTGMRGVVTLVAAAAIPAVTFTGAPIRDRAPIQAIALCVAVLTLLLQGATLQRLVHSLHISTADERHRASADVGRALHVARRAARQATDRMMATSAGGVEAAALQLVERRVEQILTAGGDLLDGRTTDEARRRNTDELVQHILARQRTALIHERDQGRLDDEVLRAVLQQLDYEEAAACTDLQQRL